MGALREQGHSVIVVGPDDRLDRRMDAGAGNAGGLLGRLPRWLYELAETGYSLISFLKLLRAYRKHRPDAFYERYNLFSLSGVALRWITGLPMALEINAPLYEERDANGGLALRRLARLTERLAWRNADICLPVTATLSEKVRQICGSKSVIEVVHNGVSPAFLTGADRQPVRARFGLHDSLVLGFVGFVRPWHGLDRIIDLLASGILPANSHLLVVGDGPVLPELKRQADKLGVASRITFAGVVQRAEMPKYVASFDIALQPYVVPYASPLKLFEYMALGKAIVAPSSSNIREILSDGRSALLFDPESPDGLANAVVRLAADPAIRLGLGKEAAATIRKKSLTWAENARTVVGLLNGAKNRRMGHRSNLAAKPVSGRAS